MKKNKPNIGIYVTCLVDLVKPSVAWATIEVLESLGCKVSVPSFQTCCGQPAYNSGANEPAKSLAKNVINEFSNFEYVVVPSGSCAGMIKLHYEELFKNEKKWLQKAQSLAKKTYEFTEFIVDVLGHKGLKLKKEVNAIFTYHDSCSGLRELGIKTQPRTLLSYNSKFVLVEGEEAETCCGFGGLFCVKYPKISESIVDDKVDDILKTGAEVVVGGDLGCLMNISGRIARRGEQVKVKHVAEVLAHGYYPMFLDKEEKV